jgi:peptidoglycan/LPS O-acetylase OafA/YrhL
MTGPTSAYADSKQHFLILDALRGVASVMVVIMHAFEVFCNGDYHKMIINHGYLAVDFFFMLSGFVMAHAYDDRWDSMTVWDFLKRRLIRLHPLIILGMVLGALLFFFQESSFFPKIAGTTVREVVIVLLIGVTLIPIPPSMDIRGWNEMHPLNGAAWSLFLEYVANILHVFILRRLSKIALSVLVLLAAFAHLHLTTQGPSGDLIGGWSLEPEQLRIGFTRLLLPYMAGMLLRRMVTVKSDKDTFLAASFILILVLSIPRLGGRDMLWVNGLYESGVILFVFPLVIYLGAIGVVKSDAARRFCMFLGDVSYPLYITHFPVMYLFYAWVVNNKVPLDQGIWYIPLLAVFSVMLAYLWLKVYDEPVRRWLTKRFM